jgi:glycosyltransferase involved in cell wall biosynthesis
LRLQIISLMEGARWGGSEELWYRVAMDAIMHKHQVQICYKQWPVLPEKLSALKNEGAEIVLRKRNIQKVRLSRLASLLTKSDIDFNSSYLSALTKFLPDIILVANGGSTDFLYSPTICKYLLHSRNVGLFFISQFYNETGPPIANREREQMIALSKRWQRFFFVSARNLSTIERHLAFTLPGTEIVSNPINIKDVAITTWPSDSCRRLACIARYDCSYKGQDVLIEALADNRFLSVNFKLNFYGAGPDKGYLIRLIEHYGLTSKVFVNDHSPNIDSIYEKNHVMVLPSIAEGTPLVVQEAMLKGRPCLATDVGGTATLVVDGVSGLLAETCSVKSLRSKFNELFKMTDDELIAMGARAFAHASAMINLDSPGRILNQLEQCSKKIQGG